MEDDFSIYDLIEVSKITKPIREQSFDPYSAGESKKIPEKK